MKGEHALKSQDIPTQLKCHNLLQWILYDYVLQTILYYSFNPMRCLQPMYIAKMEVHFLQKQLLALNKPIPVDELLDIPYPVEYDDNYAYSCLAMCDSRGYDLSKRSWCSWVLSLQPLQVVLSVSGCISTTFSKASAFKDCLSYGITQKWQERHIFSHLLVETSESSSLGSSLETSGYENGKQLSLSANF